MQTRTTGFRSKRIRWRLTYTHNPPQIMTHCTITYAYTRTLTPLGHICGALLLSQDFAEYCWVVRYDVIFWILLWHLCVMYIKPILSTYNILTTLCVQHINQSRNLAQKAESGSEFCLFILWSGLLYGNNVYFVKLNVFYRKMFCLWKAKKSNNKM